MERDEKIKRKPRQKIMQCDYKLHDSQLFTTKQGYMEIEKMNESAGKGGRGPDGIKRKHVGIRQNATDIYLKFKI